MARILFVDDDPLTLETLKRSVELFEHEAILASSGGEAQTLVTTQPPDLIMTDMNLPDMDGLTLVRHFKDNPSVADIPVVVLSASPEIDAGDLSLAAGAEEFLTKPIRLQDLQDVINRHTIE
jgi:CheY-like chemotaxis protein